MILQRARARRRHAGVHLKGALVALVLLASMGAQAELLGQPAPDCELLSLAGTPLPGLRESGAGQTLYVDFWASWCSSCVHAFPFMNALAERYRKQGLRVLAVNLDETSAAAEAFLARHPARFDIAADPTGTCPKRFDVAGMPASYLIDTNGVVRRVHLGFRRGDAADIVAAVERVLAPAATP